MDGVIHDVTNGESNTQLAYETTFDWIDANLKVIKSEKLNFEGCKIPVPTKFNVSVMREALHDFADKQVVDMIEFGFPMGFTGEIGNGSQGIIKNHRGATLNADELRMYVKTELQCGAILGPYVNNPFNKPIIIPHSNTRDKRDSNERRVIMDLSYPHGNSVNDSISRQEYLGEKIEFRLPSVDSLVDLVKKHGQGCALWKRDSKASI